MKILEIAQKRELESEAYYHNLAQEHKNQELKNVFSLLAEEEKKHAEIIDHLRKKSEMDLEVSDFGEEKNLKLSKKVLASYYAEPQQLDLYRLALKKEKESIDFYRELGEKTNEKEKQVFYYLAEQEKKHYTLMEELIELLQQGEEWVEDAEFGVRKDY